jgi:BlaI family transcriptional regulator, penicillinase repressor
MPTSTPHITPAELEIMKVLWRHGAATVRDVLEELNASGDERLAYTTVMTMMKNLADKGALAADRERQPFVYRPVARREQVLRQRVTELLHTAFDGSAVDLVLHLAEGSELTSEDLRRIEAKIEARERADVDDEPGGP